MSLLYSKKCLAKPWPCARKRTHTRPKASEFSSKAITLNEDPPQVCVNNARIRPPLFFPIRSTRRRGGRRERRHVTETSQDARITCDGEAAATMQDTVTMQHTDAWMVFQWLGLAAHAQKRHPKIAWLAVKKKKPSCTRHGTSG